MSVHQSLRVHRITKQDLIFLLDKSNLEILKKLNKVDFGFIEFLERQGYSGDEEVQILEIVIRLLGQVSTLTGRNTIASLKRFLRMLKSCQQFLFEDVPRVMNSCFSKSKGINLVSFIAYYMNILCTILSQDFFPCEIIVNNIFPTLENYMNRLREKRFKNLEIAENSFCHLVRNIEHYQLPVISDEDDDDDEVSSFRQLSVVPRSNDIVNYEIRNIPHNIIDRSYRSVDHFLSVYYRLTREDMLRSFRECVKAYSRPNVQDGSLNKNHVFDNVSVIFSTSPMYESYGILYEIKVISSKEIDWSKKEVLLPGSLVILTPDFFNTVIFATVRENPRAKFGKSKEVKLKIKLEDDLFVDELKDVMYKMIEPAAYFECYKHVLSGIKDFTEATFPLSDIITYLDFRDPEPEYMDGKKYCLHEKCGGSDKHDSSFSCNIFNPLKDDQWPEADDLELDDHQYLAFKMAMTKKVAVIQGPPGTGKTYIGVKVVKALLENTPHKPIIICCLTNHALDQFLERILKFTRKVVRLGSQSKSQILEPHTMDNLIYAVRQYQDNNPFDKAQQKSLDLIKDFASIVLTQKIIPEHDYEFFVLKELCQNINKDMKLFTLCKDKYLEESSLNNIIYSKFKDQLRIVSGSIPKSLNASILEWLNCCHESDLYEKCRKKFQEFKNKKMNKDKTIKDIWALSETRRFELFYSWRNECLEVGKRALDDGIEQYKAIMRRYKTKNVDSVKLEILRGAFIIGVTTTGACKYKDLIRFSEPRIIVIEEAAQVLESHVIASLVPHIQHLILIGDHEQLRPLPADHELSERYNLKISMFERLFRNGAPSATLVSQHRMKPCIAELLVPRPYTNYTSSKEVYLYEEIRGVQSSMYFINHSQLEDKYSSGTSSSNNFEARMIVSLAKYFTLQSYPLKDITIIAAYAAQVSLIYKYLVEKKLESIHVTTVDNYQGEENEIILVSFVRSNPSVIGFLKESNRVCVALSRAKKGMFCFGNFNLFESKSDLWKGIAEKVREKNMIGDALTLKCEKHNTVQTVKSDEDIFKFINGGCLQICDFLLPCKHSCKRRCHFDDLDHTLYLCQQPCEKMIDENRVCPRKCFEKCKRIKKKQIKLPCGHFGSEVSSMCFEEIQRLLPCRHFVTVPCYLDIQQFKCKAKELVDLDCGHTKTIDCHERYEEMNTICTELRPQTGTCGHIVNVPCSLHFDEDELLAFCKKACGILLDCGHPCVGLCRFCFDTGIHQFCTEKCELILSCGHKCEGYCNSPCPPCKQKCFRSCSHHTSCINECLRPCVKCEKPCTRLCTHSRCSNLCHETCNVKPCMESCSEVLECGHRCIGLCGDPCPYMCRLCHGDELRGNLENDRYVQLECAHVIEVNELTEHIDMCLMSFEWPSCPQCSTHTVITHSVRFKEELMKAKNICIKSYDTTEDISEILYLVQSMYGEDFIVPAQFIPIHNKITHILNKQKPRSDSLTVLKYCIMQLKKLVIIAPDLDNLHNEYFHGRFDTLLLWISYHLTNASFQQLKELELAVNQLSKEICKM